MPIDGLYRRQWTRASHHIISLLQGPLSIVQGVNYLTTASGNLLAVSDTAVPVRSPTCLLIAVAYVPYLYIYFAMNGGGGGGGAVCSLFFCAVPGAFRPRISPRVGGHGCAKGETGRPPPCRPAHVAGRRRKVRPEFRRGGIERGGCGIIFFFLLSYFFCVNLDFVWRDRSSGNLSDSFLRSNFSTLLVRVIVKTIYLV